MFITAIGTANPKNRHNQMELIDFMKEKFDLSAVDYRFLKKIYHATGIQSRYSVLNELDFSGKISKKNQSKQNQYGANQKNNLNQKIAKINQKNTVFEGNAFPTTKVRMELYKKNALNLAVEAIKDCFKNISNFDMSTITHVITVSCTGMYAPGLDIEIIEKLQLSPQTHRICINFMGCYGAFSALKMAKSICKDNPKAKVLVVSVELCSLHVQQETNFKDNIIAAALFGDGAAAALIEQEPSSNSCLKLHDFYCDILSEGKKDMAWEIGDFGFEINLSSFVPKLIQKGIHSFMKNALNQFSIKAQDIQYYAIHPGSQKILQTCDEVLGISQHQSACSYEILKKYGNMSSATILFVLKKLWSELKTKKLNANILSCGFGPGLTIESMMLHHHYEAIH